MSVNAYSTNDPKTHAHLILRLFTMCKHWDGNAIKTISYVKWNEMKLSEIVSLPKRSLI